MVIAVAPETLARQWLSEKRENDELKGFTRLHNALIAGVGEDGIIGDVCKRTEAEWLREPNFGRKSLKLLKELLHEDGMKLGYEAIPAQDKALILQRVGLEAKLADVEAERDLLKARQKAIYRALVAKEFDEDKPLPKPPRPNPLKDPRISKLEDELMKLTSRFNAATRVLWLVARAAGGKYTFNTLLDPSGLGGCPLAPGLSVDAHGEGAITITAMSRLQGNGVS